MRKLFMTILPLLMTFGTALANESTQNKYEKVKTHTIRTVFSFKGTPIISSNTRHGSLTILEGDSDKIEATAIITLKGKNVDISEELFRHIDVKMGQIGNRINIYADFNINSQDIFNHSNLGTGFAGKYGNLSIKIDFTLKVPREFIPEIEIKYGNLKIEQTAIEGSIEAKYSDIYIAHLKGATGVDIKYSNLEISKAESLELEAKYSNVNIREINNLNLESFKYGDLEIGNSINTIELENCSYSNITISSISMNLSKISINAKYSPIKLTLPKMLKTEANITANYSELSIFGTKKDTKKTSGGTTKIRSISGGTGTTKCHIEITSKYGDVTIQQK